MSFLIRINLLPFYFWLLLADNLELLWVCHCAGLCPSHRVGGFLLWASLCLYVLVLSSVRIYGCGHAVGDRSCHDMMYMMCRRIVSVSWLVSFRKMFSTPRMCMCACVPATLSVIQPACYCSVVTAVVSPFLFVSCIMNTCFHLSLALREAERGKHVKNSQTVVLGMDLNDGVYVYVCSIKQHMVLVGDLLASCLKYLLFASPALAMFYHCLCPLLFVDVCVWMYTWMDDSETYTHIMME